MLLADEDWDWPLCGGNKPSQHYTLHRSHTAGGSGAAAAENPCTQPHGFNAVVMPNMMCHDANHDVPCGIATKLGI